MTLDDLHMHLSAHGLAMSNMGSISDQTIAGVTTVATHGTGILFKVIPDQVMSMTILLADGRKVRCSREEGRDLFLATLCGFGTTGLVLNTQLKVERQFFLEEVQERMTFSEALNRLEDTVNTAEHVRLWWFPIEDRIIVDSFKRVYLVGYLKCPLEIRVTML
jgi:L-gulonolactone oxidase